MGDKNAPAQQQPSASVDLEGLAPTEGNLVWDPEERAWAVPGTNDLFDPAVGQWRFRTPHVRPLGPQGRIGADGMDMAKIGAMLGAMGAEHTMFLKILALLQEITIQAFVAAQPDILNDFSKLMGSRLNTIMQEIRNLPQTTMQPVGLRAILSGPVDPSTLVAYVPLQSVLNILSAAVGQLPHHKA